MSTDSFGWQARNGLEKAVQVEIGCRGGPIERREEVIPQTSTHAQAPLAMWMDPWRGERNHGAIHAGPA
jgi:hypothetical protein